MSMEHSCNDTERGRIKILREKTVSLSLCPPQIPQGLQYLLSIIIKVFNVVPATQP